MKRPRLLAAGVVTAVVVGVAGGLMQFGKLAGMADAKEADARMTVLWPSVTALPVDDRLVIVKAAMTCRVHSLPPGSTAAVVADCLRSGAREYDESGREEQAPIAERLEHLLKATGAKSGGTAEGSWQA